MKAFEYAAPRTEAEVLQHLSSGRGEAELLAGGTDLIGLMKQMIVTPDFVVNIKEVDSMRGVRSNSLGVVIGAVTTLDDILDSPLMDPYSSVKQAIRGISSIQLQSQGTLGGELCQRPRCWYFRNGYGLLGQRGEMVGQGDNRYHAILGNKGPAKFVHASRLAPALIALAAKVRIVGPGEDEETMLSLKDLYRTPRDENQRETVLTPGQVITHVHIPQPEGWENATYEVRQGEGPDYPLAAAAASLKIEGDIVRDARIVLGQVAPTPWVSQEARRAIVGMPVSEGTAQTAGEQAVRNASPLSENGYKVQLAAVAVKRAILLAAGFETGGF